MAGSLDELIRFLLDEIALSGQQGESCIVKNSVDFACSWKTVNIVEFCGILCGYSIAVISHFHQFIRRVVGE
jgi:hypothetical protein